MVAPEALADVERNFGFGAGAAAPPPSAFEVVALGVILAGLGARVTAVQHERDALTAQLPALTLLANVHQYLAASQAQREGA